MRDKMEALHPGVTLRQYEQELQQELGVVRISLGLASNFDDILRVIELATMLACRKAREDMMEEWKSARRIDTN